MVKGIENLTVTALFHDEVTIGHGLGVASPLHVTGEYSGLSFMLRADYVPGEAGTIGGYQCRELSIESFNHERPVTLAILQGFPVATIIRAAAEKNPPGGGTPPTGSRRATALYMHRLAQVLGQPPTETVARELGVHPATIRRWIAAS